MKKIERVMKKHSKEGIMVNQSLRKLLKIQSSRRPSMFKPQRSFNHDHDQSKKKFRRTMPQRISFTPKYENLFYGHFFYCTNFGHRVVD
jgi:hypothetical protein